MVCSYCNKVGIYQVIGRAYCRDHKKEAIAAQDRYRNYKAAQQERERMTTGTDFAKGGASISFANRSALSPRPCVTTYVGPRLANIVRRSVKRAKDKATP